MNLALLGEGSSDRALLPVLNWVLGEVTPVALTVQWIDRARFPGQARSLAEKVTHAWALGPWDLLFIHRDADSQPPEWRYAEIANAAAKRRYVAVVPVKMTEAWLLTDAPAIRAAAGRPSGDEDLELPPIKRLEDLADPKATLRSALVRAHGASGRRLRSFDPDAAVHLVSRNVEDWRPLRALPSFRRFESDVEAALVELGLPVSPPAG